MKPIVGSGEDVARAVAKGEAELGITLNSEMAVVPGVDFGGSLPGEMQLEIIGYGIVTTAARNPDAARALIDFMLTPNARRVMREGGIDAP